MNTIWSDDVQMLKRPAWPGIAYGAAAAWQQQPMDRANFFATYAMRLNIPPPRRAASLPRSVRWPKAKLLSRPFSVKKPCSPFGEAPSFRKTPRPGYGPRADLRRSRLSLKVRRRNG